MIKLQDINPQVGDLVFTNTKSIISRAINIVQRGGLEHMDDTPSHVAVVTAIYANIVVLTEAVPRGIRLCPLSSYKGVIMGIKRIKTPLHMDKGLKFLHDQLGGKYDYSALLSIVFRATLRIFGKRFYQWSKTVKNFLNSRTRFFCSELVYLYIQEVTKKKPWHSVPAETTVWDLYRSTLLENVNEDTD